MEYCNMVNIAMAYVCTGYRHQCVVEVYCVQAIHLAWQHCVGVVVVCALVESSLVFATDWWVWPAS